MELNEIAKKLDDAAYNAKPIVQISTEISISEQDAYEVQLLSINKRYARGEKFIGLKMGFTSFAKMEQMGVHDMIWGRLTDKMNILDKGDVDINEFIHPRAEPEICFRLSKDIIEEIDEENAWTYADKIAPAIEIIDSRYINFKFSLEDVIADNCSSAGLVVGNWQDSKKDLTDLDITLYFGDEIVAEGSSNDILGNPWLSLVHAVRLSLKHGQPLKKGDILMAGAATPACFLKPKTTIRAEIEGMDIVQFNTL